MIVTSMPRLMMWRIESWMARPSVTLPPALLMKSVIGRSLSFASSRSRSMQLRAVSFSISPIEVDVAKPVGLLLAQLRADGVDELGDHAIAQLTHREILSHPVRPAELSRSRGTK